MSNADSFHQKWGWINIVDMLSSNDSTKWDIVFEYGVVRFLNLVTYHKEKHEFQESKNKELHK